MNAFALLSSETRAITSSGSSAGLVEAAKQRDDLVHRLLIGKPGLLERDADPLADRGLVGPPAQAQDLDLARRRADSGPRGSRRSSSCPRRWGRAIRSTRRCLISRSIPLHGMDRAVSARILLAQVLDANRPFSPCPDRLAWPIDRETRSHSSCPAGHRPSDHRPSGRSRFGDHDDAVADHVGRMVFRVRAFPPR